MPDCKRKCTLLEFTPTMDIGHDTIKKEGTLVSMIMQESQKKKEKSVKRPV